MAKNLRKFIEKLQKEMPGNMKRVKKEVDPKFEITGLVEKLEKQGKSPAILFENVKGSKLPVLINMGASFDRLAMALGTDKQNVAETYSKREANPGELKWVDSGPVKDVILTGDDVNLDDLPITQHNEDDAGFYISAGPTIIKDPETGAVNMGLFRLQKQSKNELGFFVNPHNHTHPITKKYEKMNKEMDVAIPIGHHPAFLLSSCSRLEDYGGELEIASSLFEEPLEVVKGETVDLPIPAQAEIVIEGKVNPTLTRDEGPFGEWPRYYTGVGERWYIKVTAITMRKDAIYQDLNAAHNEHNITGAVPKIGSLTRTVKRALPAVKGVNLPISGGCRVRCYISLEKHADGIEKQAAFQALVTEPNIKFIVLVDDDIDVFNEQEVLWALSTRFQADEDLIVMNNCIGSHLIPTAYDHTRLEKGVMESKMILDATRPAPPTSFPKRAQVPQEIVNNINPEDYIEEY